MQQRCAGKRDGEREEGQGYSKWMRSIRGGISERYSHGMGGMDAPGVSRGRQRSEEGKKGRSRCGWQNRNGDGALRKRPSALRPSSDRAAWRDARWPTTRLPAPPIAPALPPSLPALAFLRPHLLPPPPSAPGPAAAVRARGGDSRFVFQGLRLATWALVPAPAVSCRPPCCLAPGIAAPLVSVKSPRACSFGCRVGDR